MPLQLNVRLLSLQAVHSIILDLLSKYDVTIVVTKKTATVNSFFKNNFCLVCLKISIEIRTEKSPNENTK